MGLLSVEAVTDPGFGLEVLGRSGIGFELFTQVPDEDPQIFVLFYAIAPPDG